MNELAAADPSQSVETRPPVIVRESPERRNESAIFETMKRGVERAVLNLEHIIRLPFNGMRDRMSVRVAKHQRSKDQDIKGALEEILLHGGRAAFGHLVMLLH
jgi:hypothetical protein